MTPPVLHRLRRTRSHRGAVAAMYVAPGGRHGHPPAAAPATAPRANELAEQQLLRVEARLLAEAKGSPAAEEDTRRWFALACARFAGAPVRQYLPILVEREVRERLRSGQPEADGPLRPVVPGG